MCKRQEIHPYHSLSVARFTAFYIFCVEVRLLITGFQTEGVIRADTHYGVQIKKGRFEKGRRERVDARLFCC